MKTCPVCKTTLFDDMDTCYGCMYKFGSNPELENRCIAVSDLAAKSAKDLHNNAAGVICSSSENLEAAKIEDRVAEESNMVVKEMTCDSKIAGHNCLFDEFLIEFERFFRDFLVDRKIEVQ